MKIAIDGPSGAGKSSLARSIARKLGMIYVDTGALYRTVGLYMREHGIDPKNEAAVLASLPDIRLRMTHEAGEQHIYLCGEDVGDRIRTPDISMYASAVSAIPGVRAYLLETQRHIARENSVVMDGRDIGTVILPDAEVKIFLVATPEARARRRSGALRRELFVGARRGRWYCFRVIIFSARGPGLFGGPEYLAVYSRYRGGIAT